LHGLATVDQGGACRLWGDFSKAAQPGEERIGEGSGRLDFQCDDRRAIPDNQIHLVAIGVAEKVQGERKPAVGPGFETLDHHQILEDPPDQRIPADLPGLANAQQMAEQSGLDEINLWRFDNALAEVFKVGRQFDDDKRGFQNRKPVPDGFVMASAIADFIL